MVNRLLYCRGCGRGPLRDKRDTTVPTWMRHYGRGLDGTCYGRARHLHELADHAPVRPQHTAIVDDLRFLLATGETDRTVLARRLGIHPSTLARALKEITA